MAKNAYAKRLDAARAAREYAIRRYTRQQMLDFVTIALGRMGYGEKRLKDFEQMLSAVYIEFAKAFTDDLKDDKECVYTKECLDRELQQYCGNSFEPYEKRYFEEDWQKEVKEDGRRNIHGSRSCCDTCRCFW